jgi:hypothetical protein
VAAAGRRYEVRTAARGWRRAGAIDDTTLARVDAEYADDRVRLGPAFRGLAFVFTVLALMASFFFVLALTGFERGAGLLAMLFGVGLCFMTEVQIGRWRRADAGAEAATGLFGLAFLLGGLFWLLDEDLHVGGDATWFLGLGAGTLAFGLGAVRWGSRVCAALATLSFFGLLARAPAGRWLWILAALVLAAPLLRGGEERRLSPALRGCCQVGLALVVLALYGAVHIGSWDSGLVESLAHGDRLASNLALRALFVLATGLLPLGLLVLGVLSRRRLLLDLGLLLGIVSLVTLRFYVHVAPLWVVLTGGGAAALLAALGLRRWLEAGRDGERRGFTAKVLFEDPSRQARLEAVVAVVGLTPAARTADATRFEGGGGRSGGGGASDSF